MIHQIKFIKGSTRSTKYPKKIKKHNKIQREIERECSEITKRRVKSKAISH
jgi:hypothetical protein